MRIFLFILISTLFFLPAANPSALATEVLFGRIVSLDLQSGEMQLAMHSVQQDKNGAGNGDADAKIMTVKFNKDQSSSWPVDSPKIGETVRVWGEFFANNGKDVFQARQITPSKMRGHRYDPTGVRGRLGKWRKGGGRQKGGGK